MRQGTKTLLTLGGFAVVGLGLSYALRANAASVSTANLRLQTFPIPLFDTADETTRARVIETVQAQLQTLGYSISRVDGISGPNTMAATQSFVREHGAEIQALTRQGIEMDAAVITAINTAYRARVGIPL